MHYNFNKYLVQSENQNSLFNSTAYMRPVPKKDLNVLLNIKNNIPVKKDRLISLIKNSEIWILFLKHIEKESEKRIQSAHDLFSQPLDKILEQS